jgi:hypothetical protein
MVSDPFTFLPEFLHIQMAKNLTCCVSSIVLDHYNQTVGESNKKAKTE